MRRALFLLALLVPLAACQLALPGRDRAPAAAANPVTGGTITTTALDAPADTPTDRAADSRPDPAAAATAPPAPARAGTAPPSRPAARSGTTPAGTGTGAAMAEGAAPVPEPVATPAPKSEAERACEDDGGTWARAGDGGGMACIYTTRDGGKRCDNKDDCDGECLARSRTCSPIKPLFGCNAVLMDNGAEVALCLD